ncbi:MAG: stage IV sporulation protein A, partial [Clostridia bacterium]|nr:stage IV sporulation protein A [Clostridia bacterium]
MEKYDVYQDIAKRTDGDVYVGVVGPVRTGKSTFVRRFTEIFVLPNIVGRNKKKIAVDEMPQSGDGNTITTTEPKFVPAEGIKVSFGGKTTVRMRLIDCVGFVVEGALGHEENGSPRLVKTPWSDQP